LPGQHGEKRFIGDDEVDVSSLRGFEVVKDEHAGNDLLVRGFRCASLRVLGLLDCT